MITTLAEQHTVLGQNLLASDIVRRLAWTPPAPAAAIDESIVAAHLRTLGARPWQVEICARPLAEALHAIPPVPIQPELPIESPPEP